MYIYKGKPERMKRVNDVALKMRGHAVRYAGVTKLVDFAIDRAVEAYEGNPSAVEQEFREYMTEMNGRKQIDQRSHTL